MTVFLSYSSLYWPELSQKYCELQVLRPTYLCTSVNCSVPTSQALHLSRVSTGMGLFYNLINHQRNQTILWIEMTNLLQNYRYLITFLLYVRGAISLKIIFHKVHTRFLVENSFH